MASVISGSFLLRSSPCFQTLSLKIRLITSIPLIKAIDDSRAFFISSSSPAPLFSRLVSTCTSKFGEVYPSCLVTDLGPWLFNWTPRHRVSSIYDSAPKVARPSPDHGRRWLVKLMNTPFDHVATEQELFNVYIKTLACAVGSEEKAQKLIYLVSCGEEFGFGVEIDFETMLKLFRVRAVATFCEDAYYYVREMNSNVQSSASFSPFNKNHQYDNIFAYHHLSDRNCKWNHDRWLVNIKQPDCRFTTSKQIKELYIKMLTEVVGSKKDARMKIYITWFALPFGFGVEIDEETSNKLRGLPGVLKVLPDYSHHIFYDNSEILLRVWPSYEGLIFSQYNLTEEYSSEDWLLSMEEHGGKSVNFNSSVKFDPHRSDVYLKEFDQRCNCEHWFIKMEIPHGDLASIHQRIEYCTQALGSAVKRNEAKKRIYRITTRSHFFGFGLKIDEETANKITGMQGVLEIRPDYFLNKCHDVPKFSQLNVNDRLNDIFSYHHLSEGNSIWNFDHWLIHIKQPHFGFRTERQTIEFCVQMLAEVLGSEEDSRKKIYIVWFKMPFGFGAEIDKETSNKLKGLPDVLTVLPDHAFDVKNMHCEVLVVSPLSYLTSKWTKFIFDFFPDRKSESDADSEDFYEITKDSEDMENSEGSESLEDIEDSDEDVENSEGSESLEETEDSDEGVENSEGSESEENIEDSDEDVEKSEGSESLENIEDSDMENSKEDFEDVKFGE